MGLLSDLIRELTGGGDRVYRHHNHDVINPSLSQSFEPELHDLDHIHNVYGYLKLWDLNTKRFKKLNKRLRRRYGVYFHEETLKEIALDKLYRECTMQEIEQLIIKQEKIQTIQLGDDL